MQHLGILLALALVSAGCAPAAPSATQYPTPLPSAAQPAASGKGDTAYARRALETVRSALRHLDPEAALERVSGEGLVLKDTGVTANCKAAGGEGPPLLICHLGPEPSQPVAQALFWHEGEGWSAQLYPQVAPQAASERQALLAEQGCRLGCYSGIVQARHASSPDGRELLVVVNLGFAAGQPAEEVHLLRLSGGEWRAVWAPGAGAWNYGHATVELSAKGVAQFKVRSSSWLRGDTLAGYFGEPEAGEHRRFEERWMRKGSAYVMADRQEEPSPYSTLVRVVHYLSTGADEKAALLLAPDLSLEEARKALAQKPKRQGWTATRWGDHGFLLDTRGAGRPDLGVRFIKQGDQWVLAEVWRV